MSGQPVKKPGDAERFRKVYLANLKLRSELDDLNLQANKLYKRTGQIPEQPSDFRTSEEKLADLMELRLEARQLFKEITDGKNANSLAQNLNPDQITFYVQRYKMINEEISKQYSKGIPEDVFTQFLNALMM